MLGNIPVIYQSVVDLGPVEKIFSQRPITQLFRVLTILLVLGLSICATYYTLVVYPSSGFSPAIVQKNTPFFLGFAGFLFITSVYASWKVFLAWRESIVVYQDGFAHFDGKSLKTFRWSDITSLSMNVVRYMHYGVIPGGTERTYTLLDRDGQKFKLGNSLDQVQKFIEILREKIFPYLLNQSEQAYMAGQTIEFGPISLSRIHGLQIGKKNYGWGDIDEVRVNNGQLEIKSKKKGLFANGGASIASIPNIDVLLELVSQGTQEYLSSGK